MAFTRLFKPMIQNSLKVTSQCKMKPQFFSSQLSDEGLRQKLRNLRERKKIDLEQKIQSLERELRFNHFYLKSKEYDNLAKELESAKELKRNMGSNETSIWEIIPPLDFKWKAR